MALYAVLNYSIIYVYNFKLNEHISIFLSTVACYILFEYFKIKCYCIFSPHNIITVECLNGLERNKSESNLCIYNSGKWIKVYSGPQKFFLDYSSKQFNVWYIPPLKSNSRPIQPHRVRGLLCYLKSFKGVSIFSSTPKP